MKNYLNKLWFTVPAWAVCLSLLLALVVTVPSTTQDASAQVRKNRKPQSSHLRPAMTAEERALVESAIGVVCEERQRDPKASVPIDEMQARPSLPLQSPEAVAGAERAQRLLPVARNLVKTSLREVARRYGIARGSAAAARLERALSRVNLVKRIKPDMESRDNAAVYLHNPHTITFGTIFLAGLPSDEGMISVLAHELVHIADGNQDSLFALFRRVGDSASHLTGLTIRGQKAEELSCDLVGMLAARAYVDSAPTYEPLPRRISRSMAHNCVQENEGDEDHLSPRDTIRALLSLDRALARELVHGR